MTDLRQTFEYANYLKSLGWKIEIINGNYYFLKKLPFFGWFLKIQRPKKNDYKEIIKLIDKYKPWKVIFEPLMKDSNILTSDFNLTKSPFLPTKTIQLNLSHSLHEILSKMHQKTRYNIQLAIKKKYKIEKSEDINTFVKLWSKEREGLSKIIISQKRNIINIYNSFSKKNKSNILFAIQNDEITAGLLILESKDTAFYMFAFTNKVGKKVFAPTLLTWEAIDESKKKGLKVFDFDGIYDERFPVKSWKGFTKFKQGFGGNEIEFPGCFVKKH